MGFWNRKSEDPLLKMFLEKYGLNLLSLPRENVRIGDLYMYDSKLNRVTSPGSVINFLTPKFKLPEITENETLADISGQSSDEISVQAGFDFIEGFFKAVASVGISGKIRGAYEKAKNSKMIFAFPNAKRDYVDPFLLGSKLIGHKFNIEHPLFKEDNAYYIVTAVVKSKSMSIEIKGKDKQASDISVEITNIINSSGTLNLEKNQTGKIIYYGDKNLGFGIEVYELRFNSIDGKLSMNSPDSSVRFRGQNALIGDPEGDAFIDVTYNFG